MKAIVNLSAPRALSHPRQTAVMGVEKGFEEKVNDPVAAPLRQALIASRRHVRRGFPCSISAARAYERAQELAYGEFPPLFDFKI